jgi:hypothetical protein
MAESRALSNFIYRGAASVGEVKAHYAASAEIYTRKTALHYATGDVVAARH